MRRICLLLALVLTVACSLSRRHTEILWDTYGVPHIFAAENKGLFRAYGYAQAQSHGDLILRLYGQARGKAAEYWGEEYLDSDRWVRTMGVPELSVEWLADQEPEIRSYLDAFADGVNSYAARHADRIADEVEVVLPVTSQDLLAHILRVIHFSFTSNPQSVQYYGKQLSSEGSNAWAVAPSRSASGHAMLLMNPHLPWGGMMTWYEAQLTAPGVNAYGASLVGQPILGIAFNDYLGWTHTVNTHDGADLYVLTLKDSGYLYDGQIRHFATSERTLRVRSEDGRLRREKLTIRRSVQGPVVYETGNKALALRVVGLDQPHLFKQYWDMARATNLAEFEAANRRLQMPMFTVMYAGRDGHIMHLFGGRTPKRPRGDWAYWQRPVPGDTSATLWTDTHPYDELPRIIDPTSGWLQNANDPPWTTTFPRAINPADFPPYMAPRFMSYRAQQSARLLDEDESISFDEMVRYKHSTRMMLADRILDDLLEAARKYGSADAKRGAEILAKWDRQAQADSRGAVLFAEFVDQWRESGKKMFAEPWSASAPRVTPRGLASPAAAAATLAAAVRSVEQRHGSADVAWGEVNRLRIAGTDLPANGAPGYLGVFRVVNFTKGVASGGDSFVAAVEFSDPVRARALLSYGNSSQPGSPHRADQLELFASQKLRPVWRTREEIEANLERREEIK